MRKPPEPFEIKRVWILVPDFGTKRWSTREHNVRNSYSKRPHALAAKRKLEARGFTPILKVSQELEWTLDS